MERWQDLIFALPDLAIYDKQISPKEAISYDKVRWDVNMWLQIIQKQCHNELPKIQIRQSPWKPTKTKTQTQVVCIML